MELPYYGWFNGDALKMIEVGTYETYRPVLVGIYAKQVAKNHMKQEEVDATLEAYDTLWAANKLKKKAEKTKKPSEPKAAKRQYRRRKSK